MRLPPNYGSVYKLKGNRRKPWVARIQTGVSDKGLPVRKIIGYYAGQKEALQALAEYHNGPKDFGNRKLTFADVFELFIPDHLKGKSKSLEIVYYSAYKNFKPLHNLLFNDIKAYNIEDVIKAIEGSASKKSQMVTLIGLMYK